MSVARSIGAILVASVMAFLLSSCATGKSSGNATSTVTDTNMSASKDIESFHLSDPEGPKVVDEELENIPSEVNPLVEKWITYFKGKGRPHMERYLARSTRYEKLMKKVLRDNGLPEDIFYIAMIESGFSSAAVSHASAVGYWQFIRGTGKRYGLQIDRFMDDRRDPVLATQAAADYFKGLYSVFGSWYLAMASYNVGENRVKKEVMSQYTRDFWELAKKNRFPKETINYIPKYIAAKLIAKNPEKYDFKDIDYLPPIEFDSIALNKSVNLRVMADKMNYNYEDFKALNPKFKGEIAPLTNNMLDIRIPVGQKDIAITAANESTVEKVEYIADTGDVQNYRIKKGDNLNTVARKFRTSVAYLRDLNDISKGKKLKVGMMLAVPDRTPVSQRSAKTNVSATPRGQSAVVGVAEGSARYYIVQSGDSLFTIAKRYNTTVDHLKRINNIQRGKTLKVGLKLKLPNGDTAGQNDSQQGGRNESRVQARKSKHANHRAPATNSSKKIVKHIVKRGENLHGIAAKYNVDFQSLKAKNNIKNPSKLFVGSMIMVPVAQASR